jgi:hypothetical protein
MKKNYKIVITLNSIPNQHSIKDKIKNIFFFKKREAKPINLLTRSTRHTIEQVHGFSEVT